MMRNSATDVVIAVMAGVGICCILLGKLGGGGHIFVHEERPWHTLEWLGIVLTLSSFVLALVDR